MRFHLRWPTARELRITAAVIPLFLLFTIVLRGCHSADLPFVGAPPGVTLDTTPTTASPADLTQVQLAAADGTTTTAPARATGTSHLFGAVNGPQGPVPGATVRVEHLVEGAEPIDVVTGPDGRWDLPNIAGGRYRARAYLAPTLAQTTPDVFFLVEGEQREENLTVDPFTGAVVLGTIAPDPPLLHEPLNLVVRVATRTVDGDGVVRAQPVANALVVLTGFNGFGTKGSTSVATNAQGDAVFSLECRNAGANQFQVQVRPTPADQPQTSTIDVNACSDPTTTTTATTQPGSSTTGTATTTTPPTSSEN